MIGRRQGLVSPLIHSLPRGPVSSEPQRTQWQSSAGGCSSVDPVNVIVRFVRLSPPEKAKRILLVLEQAGVIECVERGAPHTPGKRGKSSVWRYNGSMNQ